MKKKKHFNKILSKSKFKKNTEKTLFQIKEKKQFLLKKKTSQKEKKKKSLPISKSIKNVKKTNIANFQKGNFSSNSLNNLESISKAIIGMPSFSDFSSIVNSSINSVINNPVSNPTTWIKTFNEQILSQQINPLTNNSISSLLASLSSTTYKQPVNLSSSISSLLLNIKQIPSPDKLSNILTGSSFHFAPEIKEKISLKIPTSKIEIGTQSWLNVHNDLQSFISNHSGIVKFQENIRAWYQPLVNSNSAFSSMYSLLNQNYIVNQDVKVNLFDKVNLNYYSPSNNNYFLDGYNSFNQFLNDIEINNSGGSLLTSALDDILSITLPSEDTSKVSSDEVNNKIDEILKRIAFIENYITTTNVLDQNTLTKFLNFFHQYVNYLMFGFSIYYAYNLDYHTTKKLENIEIQNKEIIEQNESLKEGIMDVKKSKNKMDEVIKQNKSLKDEITHIKESHNNINTKMDEILNYVSKKDNE